MMLTPAMQGVILAIAKARQIFDNEGPEAGLIKVWYLRDTECLNRALHKIAVWLNSLLYIWVSLDIFSICSFKLLHYD